MLPAGCPPWQYDKHPDRWRLLPNSTAKVLAGIQAGQYPVKQFARDTRPIHKKLFAGLGPPGHAYYVGTYRGSHQKCLANYEVSVDGLKFASPPGRVLDEIYDLGHTIARMADEIQSALDAANPPLDEATRAVAVARLASDAFVKFLTIHPYADGNGHVARALLWIVLFKFGYKPNHWTIDPRPPFPNYFTLIQQHRDGTPEALEQFVLSCISANA